MRIEPPRLRIVPEQEPWERDRFGQSAWTLLLCIAGVGVVLALAWILD